MPSRLLVFWLFFIPFLYSQEYDPRLGDIVANLIGTEGFSVSEPITETYDEETENGGRFAIEVDAADYDSVWDQAEKSGFVIEKKLQSFDNIYIAKHQNRRKRDTEKIISELLKFKAVKWAEPLIPRYREKRAIFRSSLYDDQLLPRSSLSSMSIPDTWGAGVTGKGVTIAVLDDGIDYEHDDLRKAIDMGISYNFVESGADILPRPGSDQTHGTRCAGVIAMAANNSRCGVGVAYNVKLGGLKVLDESQFLNDAIEGDSLAYKSDQIDIYSVSWGPKDDGKSAEKPGPLAQKALEYGTMHGRRGLGSLYVWASGNGGREGDDCAMDGYASNLHTITIGVASSHGTPPWYAEGCSAVLAAVTEDGTSTEGMMTTDVGNKCVRFSGSSAAAPLGAGILALALQANPLLSQRDIQHLIVRTSESESLVKNFPDQWIINGAGLPFSRYLGYGILNAQKLTKAARKWKRVGPLSSCAKEMIVSNGTFYPDFPLLLNMPFYACKGTSAEVNWLERLRIDISIEHPRRGLISLLLTSPSGTTVQLLHPRKDDDSSKGLEEWPFVSVAHWGENPEGTWKLKVVSEKHEQDSKVVGFLRSVRLTAHGTKEDSLKEKRFILQTN